MYVDVCIYIQELEENSPMRIDPPPSDSGGGLYKCTYSEKSCPIVGLILKMRARICPPVPRLRLIKTVI